MTFPVGMDVGGVGMEGWEQQTRLQEKSLTSQFRIVGTGRQTRRSCLIERLNMQNGDEQALPVLGAFRTFERPARHRSFTRAAAELALTPGCRRGRQPSRARTGNRQLQVKCFSARARGGAPDRRPRDPAWRCRGAQGLGVRWRGYAMPTATAPERDGHAVHRHQWLVPRLTDSSIRMPGVRRAHHMSRHAVRPRAREMDSASRFGNRRLSGSGGTDRLITETVTTGLQSETDDRTAPAKSSADLRHPHADSMSTGRRWASPGRRGR
jgi:hypothetical protein